ncbi:hypothetical protein, partial [uncultured Actinomyces sp.]|uniref:hypothetical protein n=1 Tax=uncultured Actinomyces sp. TaxID=249061 RepID=UPI0028DD00D2
PGTPQKPPQNTVLFNSGHSSWNSFLEILCARVLPLPLARRTMEIRLPAGGVGRMAAGSAYEAGAQYD